MADVIALPTRLYPSGSWEKASTELVDRVFLTCPNPKNVEPWPGR